MRQPDTTTVDYCVFEAERLLEKVGPASENHSSLLLPNPCDLEVVSFGKFGESETIDVDELLKRAKALNAVWGAEHALCFLSRQEEFPKEFLGHALLFPGSIWKFRMGIHIVSIRIHFIVILAQHNGQERTQEWHLSFYDRSFASSVLPGQRLLRLKSRAG